MPPGTPGSGARAAGAELKTDADSVFSACTEIENEMAELKAKYEQYFLGIEKMDPFKVREDLKRRLNALKTSFIRNTGAKFRVGQLAQKFLTYERLWLKTGWAD